MQSVASRAIGVALYLAASGIALVAVGALATRFLPLLDLLAQFLLPAIVAAFATAVVAAATGRYLLAVLGVVVSFLNIALVWSFEQQPAPSDANGSRFKLLSFNIYYHNSNLDGVEQLVRETDADVVVLLEVTSENRAALRPLDQLYPYSIECWEKPRCDILILSRAPLTDLQPAMSRLEDASALAAADLELGGCRLSLFATHLSLPFPFHRPFDQSHRANAMTDIVAGTIGPKILVGDFNAAPWGVIVGSAAERADLSVLTGFGGTWPTALPAAMGIPIDHMLASSDFTFVSRQLKTVPGSDHRAVIAEIAVSPSNHCAKSQ